MTAILTLAQTSPAQSSTMSWLPIALIIAVGAAALLLFAAWANAPFRRNKKKK